MKRMVLAVSSGGGHWVQLQKIMNDYAEQPVCFATTQVAGLEGARHVEYLPDANKTTPIRCLLLVVAAARLVFRVRPRVVISTGAAPGVIVAAIAKLTGAKVVWIDSVANAEKLSLSGRLMKPFCDVRLSQWRDVAERHGCLYRGSVL